jgi:hypothetical protein
MSTDRLDVLTPKFVIGLFVLVAGVLLTVENLNLADTDGLFDYWPVSLIALGGVMLARVQEGQGRAGSVMLMVVGSWLLLNTLDIVDVRFWELFWPLVLIVVGTNLIMQAVRPREDAPLNDGGVFNALAIMGGVKRASGPSPFRRGELNSVMGGGELDLRLATMPSGGEGVIEVFSLMGGYKVRVPDAWTVDNRVFAFLGGVEDKTTPAAEVGAPRLVVRGTIVMGGLTLTN